MGTYQRRAARGAGRGRKEIKGLGVGVKDALGIGWGGVGAGLSNGGRLGGQMIR